MKLFKGILKFISAVLLLAVVCWGGMFGIDYHRSGNLKAPLFVIPIKTVYGENTVTYQGLGYHVVVTFRETKYSKQILSVTMTALGRVVSASIT